MRIILTGGITGGHIYPALAIGDKFRDMVPGCEIIFIGSGDGLESDIVPKNGYELRSVTTRSLNRSNPLKIADTILGTEKGKREAYRIMKSFKPDIVMSTGSFVSVPVVLAAKKYGAKIFIHEQNAFPGVANRSMFRYADRLFLGFKTAGKYFSDEQKLVYSGNPVRKDFGGISKSEARKKLNIPEDDFLIFVFGGSLGASGINSIGKEVIRAYGGKEGVSVLFGTGNRFYDSVSSDLAKRGLSAYLNVGILPYVHDMPNVLAASDIVIARSGALSVSEITVSGRAAIFVPSPNVTGDHQYYNAKEVADNGGAVIVHEDEEAPQKIVGILREMMNDPQMMRSMEEGSLASAPPNATEIIYNEIMKVCGGSDV